MAFTISGISNYSGITFTTTQPGPQPYLWSWGGNGSGSLGLGNLTYYSSPKQVGALTTWSSISASLMHSLAIG
jgi:alpha-tubulin suppressor-like RCC1 family protein